MRKNFIVVVLAVAAGTPFGAEVSAGPAEWWRVKEIQRAVELTPAQVAALDALFRAGLPERKRLRAELDRLEAQLAGAMARGDESALMLIEAVEQIRARRNTRRGVMLFGMYKVLSPRQRQLLSRLPIAPPSPPK